MAIKQSEGRHSLKQKNYMKENCILKIKNLMMP